MRAAIIEDGVITNIILTRTLDAYPTAKWLTEHSQLSIGDEYDDSLANIEQQKSEPKQSLIDIIIESVSGNLPDFDDKDNEYKCNHNELIVLTSTVVLPDQQFVVPFKRLDTGREIPVVAKINSNTLIISVTFPEQGYWVCNNDLINKNLQNPLFNMNQILFMVV